MLCYNSQALGKGAAEYAAMAQLVEHILGKDEVISSTLISSFRVALAQLDRVFGYEPKGRGFESLMPRKREPSIGWFLFYIVPWGRSLMQNEGKGHLKTKCSL